MKRILVGMSGGVDSSVSAYLLKEAGYQPFGLFMKNWEEKDENGVCTTAADYRDVGQVAAQLDLPYHTVDFVNEYRDQVFKEFVSDLEAGLTPNPDILCNREIKFNVFFKQVEAFGLDGLATGHYAQVFYDEAAGEHHLFRAADAAKDQTYFLGQMPQRVLAQTLFPIGHLEKKTVREIALRANLATAKKKDSTGICFIGERNFPAFIAKYIKPRRGELRYIDTNAWVGEHAGAQFYTLGQRHGLGLGGEGEPWFVVKKDIHSNTVWVVRGEDHPALYSRELDCTELHWIGKIPPGPALEVTAKVRYRQADQACTVYLNPKDPTCASVRFNAPQRAVTPGQFAVFYLNNRCLGSGKITHTRA